MCKGKSQGMGQEVEDKFDKNNLKLSGHAVRNLMGPTLLVWVVSLTGPDTTGPELFLVAAHQVSFMTAALVRSVCNKMGAFEFEGNSWRECQ